MNQEKVGNFIAQCRKEKNLTQLQLAEKLNMSNKSISKWETGKGMPDSSIMLELCHYLGITVNELLSGEHLESEQYEKKADENIISFAKEVEKNKRRNKKIIIVTLIVLFAFIIFIGYKIIWYYAEFNLKYDEKIIKCEINDDNISCEIKGLSIVNLTYEQKNTDNETLIFFTGKIYLENKIRSHFEIWDSMARFANEQGNTFATIVTIDREKELNDYNKKIKVYYTNMSLRKIHKANNEELQKIIEQSYLMCEN